MSSIDERRRQVIAEIDVPGWYWWGLALGWVVVGVVSDLGIAWATVGAMLTFGAAHASVAHHVLSGRHRSGRLSVRADVVDRHIAPLIVGFLLLLVGVTVAVAVLVTADGADHPSTIASGVAAVAVLGGGPRLMTAIRRRTDTSGA